jgi:hypothetical protein
MKDENQTNTEGTPASVFTWRLEADTFHDALMDLLRRGDVVLPRAAVDEIARDLIAVIPTCESGQREEVRVMLNRLASIGTAALRFHRPELFDSVVLTYLNIYLSGFDEHDSPRRATGGAGISGASLWLDVILRILAVGAYAVRLEAWEAVRRLALQILPEFPHRAAGETQSWLRHAEVQASNANLFNRDKELRKEGELISLAHRLVEADLSLRWDLPAGDVRLLNSILQFDLLALLVVCAHVGDYRKTQIYPSMAAWGLRRAEPVVLKLLEDSRVQEKLFTAPAGEKLLADVLREVQGYARHLDFSSWGWGSQQVRDLLSRHPEERGTR